MNDGFTNVQDVIENYKSAVYEQDVEKFVSAYATNIQVYDCWEDWEYKGISKWKEAVNGWFNHLKEGGVQLKVELNDLVVEENAGLAFIYSNMSLIAYNGSEEKLRQITNRFTFGLKKENNSWKIIHQHSSLSISMETGKCISNLK
ncbi:nuclear transport factor 2 family protein [Fictibacillus sp. WQ 8-8]|uniref:YybH family protein n=1 Tax=Fictibacillus sp. WQ 8-8 TaxID=2938788 RepID=UPI002108DDDD|nr:nuclear transport factor 2 family protein [Fictibacillus sp. WQ 8-8]MCQ6268598.1 nuclear transport factor 2 family protein [Fictibacillus sp. WQ 8-8]